MHCPWCDSDLVLGQTEIDEWLRECPFCGEPLSRRFIDQFQNAAEELSKIIKYDKNIISQTEKLIDSIPFEGLFGRFGVSLRVAIHEGVMTAYARAKDAPIFACDAVKFMRCGIGLNEERVQWIDHVIRLTLSIKYERRYKDKNKKCLMAARKALSRSEDSIDTAWTLMKLSYFAREESIDTEVIRFFLECQDVFKDELLKDPVLIRCFKNTEDTVQWTDYYYYLGLIYAYGIGTDIDLEKAYRCFEKSRDVDKARIELVVRTFLGVGCVANEIRALFLNQKMKSESESYLGNPFVLKENDHYTNFYEVTNNIIFFLEGTCGYTIAREPLTAFWSDYLIDNMLLDEENEYCVEEDSGTFLKKYVNKLLDSDEIKKAMATDESPIPRIQLAIRISQKNDYVIDEIKAHILAGLEYVNRNSYFLSISEFLIAYNLLKNLRINGKLVLQNYKTELVSLVLFEIIECSEYLHFSNTLELFEFFLHEIKDGVFETERYDELFARSSFLYLSEENRDRNPERAKDLLKEYIKKSHSQDFSYSIGLLYLMGNVTILDGDGNEEFLHTTMDYNLAYQAFLKSWKKKNDMGSVYYLAHMFEKGFSVNKDIKEAVRLYQIAADGGDIQAKEWLISHRILGKRKEEIDFKSLEETVYDVIDKGTIVDDSILQEKREELYRNQNRLVVDEVLCELNEDQGIKNTLYVEKDTKNNENPNRLTDEQIRVLNILLEGKKIPEKLANLEKEYISPQVIIESINIQAINYFGDVLIEGDPPKIIPEYLELCRKVVDGSWKI